jgi:hypothetical protein
MSKSVMISMLRQGSTGTEILSILDTLVGDTVSTSDMPSEGNMPTLEYIDF